MAKKVPEIKETRRVLGRGLDALLPIANAAAQAADSEYQRIPIERIRPRSDQPRKRFDETALRELTDSMREQGMIQPVVVRKLPGGDYELIVGERRWRAAQRAGLREVKVVIQDVTPDVAFEMAVVENLQRENLDPVETAQAYQRLIDSRGYSQETLASRVGKDRSTVANTLRLLQLPEEVLVKVAMREISEGHARAILSLGERDEMIRLAQKASEKKWSVRQTEVAARRGEKRKAKQRAKAAEPRKSPNVRDLENRLQTALGMSVVVRQDPGAKSGTVEFAYDSLDQLDVLIGRILGE